MARRYPMMTEIIGALGPAVVRAWYMTMRWRIIGGYKDPLAHRSANGPVIWAFWHSQQMFAAYIGRNRGVRILISRHRDGDFVAAAASGLGLVPVRGSTSSGGAEALVELVRESAGHDIAFTPDGPRGPREIVQPGVIAAARLTGMPIMPVAAAAWPRIRFNNWDGYVLPFAGAKAAITIGEVFSVPRDADRDECERCRVRLERELTEATRLCEREVRAAAPSASWPKHHHPYCLYGEEGYRAHGGRWDGNNQ